MEHFFQEVLCFIVQSFPFPSILFASLLLIILGLSIIGLDVFDNFSFMVRNASSRCYSQQSWD